MYKTSLQNFVAGIKQKNQYKDIQLLWLIMILIYILDEIERREKLSLEGI